MTVPEPVPDASSPPSLASLIEALAATSIRFDYDRRERRVWLRAPVGESVPQTLRAAARVHQVWLATIAQGRASGHALAPCDRCGEPTMASIVTPAGTIREERHEWPTCRRSTACGGRHVPRPVDLAGVEHVRPPSRRGHARKPNTRRFLGPTFPYPGSDDR